MTGILEAKNGIGDDDISRLGLDRLGIDLRRPLRPCCGAALDGDQTVFGQRLVGQFLGVENLRELDVRRRIVGNQNRHLLQHAYGRGCIVVLLVVVNKHLVLGAGAVCGRARQALIDREPRRINFMIFLYIAIALTKKPSSVYRSAICEKTDSLVEYRRSMRASRSPSRLSVEASFGFSARSLRYGIRGRSMAIRPPSPRGEEGRSERSVDGVVCSRTSQKLQGYRECLSPCVCETIPAVVVAIDLE